MPPKEQRTRYWVEGKVQGALVRRLLLYWLIVWSWILGLTCLATATYSFFLMEFSWGEMIGQVASSLWVPALVSLVVIPLIARDYLKLSNRFCGPMVRFRRAVQQVTLGETPAPVQLRKDDYWKDFAADFNDMLRAIEQRQATTSTQPEVDAVQPESHATTA